MSSATSAQHSGDEETTAFFAADPDAIRWPYPMYARWRQGNGVVHWEGGPATCDARLRHASRYDVYHVDHSGSAPSPLHSETSCASSRELPARRGRCADIVTAHAITLFVGCYTNDSSTGIRVYGASDPAGALVVQSHVDGIEHPSFLAVRPDGAVLYAVSETASPDGGLVALRIDPAHGSPFVIEAPPRLGDAWTLVT